MSESAAEDRTEAPTQKRLDDAREQGQLPVSRDTTMLASFLGAAAGCLMLAPAAGHRLTMQAGELLGTAGSLSVGGGEGPPLFPALTEIVVSAVLLIGSVAVPATGAAVMAVLLQTGFYVANTPIRFQPSRLSPAAGLARVLSAAHGIDFLKSLGRLALLFVLVWSVLGSKPRESIGAIGLDPPRVLAIAGEEVRALLGPLFVALAGFAAFDLFMVRFQHMKKMRMTREQIRLEARDSEGDPHLKSKLRRIRLRRSRQRMMTKVKTADVIVTNPTHYAIALKYDRDRSAAPKVVAKGVDFVAARIREAAASHGIPMVPNPPLARALYQVELESEIPAEHFRAVAEVIAYVWKLKNRHGPRL